MDPSKGKSEKKIVDFSTQTCSEIEMDLKHFQSEGF